MPESLHWLEADNTDVNLNDGTNYALIDYDGLGTPPFQHQVSAIPGIDGDLWSGVMFDPRIVTVRLLLKAATLAALQTRRRAFIASFNPRRGAGILAITLSNGAAYYFDCVLAEQLALSTVDMFRGSWDEPVILRLRSTSLPFLYDPNVNEQTVQNTSATFFPFSFAFRLAASSLFANVSVSNDGDVTTPVRVTITGPGVAPVIRNVTTGKSFGFSSTLAAGSTIVVDTNPLSRSVLLNGASAWQYLTNTSELWQLARGANTIEVDMSGTNTDSAISIRHYDRYLGV